MGAVLISTQKRLSPLVAVAVTFVSVCASAPGRAGERLKSTLTEVEPFLMGKLIALKVREPTPSGKLQVFDMPASPLQETVPARVFISRSKLAADTSSSRFPVPVMVVFVPVVIVAGEKPVIFTCCPPQSDQVSFNVAASAATTAAAPMTAFMMLLRTLSRSRCTAASLREVE